MASTRAINPFLMEARASRGSRLLMLCIVVCGFSPADGFLFHSPSMPVMRRHLSPASLFPFDDMFGHHSLLSPRCMLNTMHQLEHEADRILSNFLENAPSEPAANATTSPSEGNITASTDSSAFELRLRPRFDVDDRKDAFMLTAATPGLRKEDLSVDVVDGHDGAAYLIISGHTSSSSHVPASPGSTAGSEDPSPSSTSDSPSAEMPMTLPLTLKASYSKFERRIKLPSTVDRDSVKASYDNGLLAVSIPKNPKRQELKLRVPIA